MSRSLVHIEKILSLAPIKGADFIEQAQVLGWTCVVKKGEFQPASLCIFFEIDSLLPEKPEYEFLRKNKFRIRTQKLRGVLSQGLALPIDILPKGDYKIGQDVTELVGVTKYEAPIFSGGNGFNHGETKGNFPEYVPKTDEIRIQAKTSLVEEFAGKECYITVKCDGTSATFGINNDEEFVCSRNLMLRNPKDVKFTWKHKLANYLFPKVKHIDWLGKYVHRFTKTVKQCAYWQINEKYQILHKISVLGKNYAIQGEICGPGIQKNKLGLKDLDLFVFNIYDIDAQKYLSYNEFKMLCIRLELKTVPILDEHFIFNHSVEQLLEMAKGKYEGTDNHREGIVIRPVEECFSEILSDNSIVPNQYSFQQHKRGRLSVKVINNDFLLKEED